MAVTTSNTNKPLVPRGADLSRKEYNKAKLFSGKALDFDGVNDYVDLNGFTMAGNVATICFYAQFDNDGYLLDLNPNRLVIKNHNTQGFQVYNNNAWTVYDTTDMTTMGFYVIVSDGTTQRAYYNGHQLSGDKTITAIDFSAITEFKLGSYHQTGSPWYNGKIAGFKIFNTALTAAQVSDLYNNPEKIVPTGVEDTALKLWLPMMEGAGTTAYDGSGNGNHGTISGATYVNGVGAPVAQTAVIDWNKNKNSITNSTDFSAAAGWLSLTSGTGTAVVTNNYAESPYGGQTAARLQATKGTGYGVISFTPAVSTSGTYVSSVWAKSNTGSTQSVSMYSRNSTTGKQNVTTEWTRFEFTGSGVSNYFNIGSLGTADASIDILIWGAQMVLDATEVGPYVPTIGTAQTTPVLLPQGLTSGRDITGVNLFENVRKQGALNLDGNSWAEVHDNASLDFGTGAFTLEAWARVKFVDQGTPLNVIISLGGSAASEEALYIHDTITARFEYNGDPSVTGTLTQGDWVHLVGTYDGTNATIYLNGGLSLDQDARTAADITNDLVKYIGRDNQSTRFYNDQIAQPRIYNRALSPEEIERNYHAGKRIYK